MMRQSRQRDARRVAIQPSAPPVETRQRWTDIDFVPQTIRDYVIAGPMTDSSGVGVRVYESQRQAQRMRDHYVIDDDVEEPMTTISPPTGWVDTRFVPRDILDMVEEYSRRERVTRNETTRTIPRRSGMSVSVGDFIRNSVHCNPRMHEECKHESTHHCTVCITDIQIGEQMTRLTKCIHVFHAECVDIWLNTKHTCPICRSVEDDWRPNVLTPEDVRNQFRYAGQAGQVRPSFRTFNMTTWTVNGEIETDDDMPELTPED